MFGFSREELEATSFQATITGIPPYTLEHAQAHMKKAVAEGPQVFEWLARRKDGGNIWVEVSLRLTEIGGEDRILALVRDIDDRKRMEEQLLQSEKLQAVGTLAGGVAHDFNNQLTGIIGWTDLIRDRSSDDPELETATANILTSAKRASDLTAQLLAFARKGKFEAKARGPPPIDQRSDRAADPHHRQADLHRDQARSRSPLHHRGPFPAPECPAQPGGERPRRHARGRASGFRHPQPGIWAGTRNCAGAGIWNPDPSSKFPCPTPATAWTPHTLKSIFEPFFTTKKATKGTGLGLAAVYGTVNSHQGCIDVTSLPGDGSTFRILLPLGPRPDSTAASEIRIGTRGTGRILVIDDEEILIKTVSAILTKEGYETVTCTDSSEGLEVFRFSPEEFDLILLDMIMPGMNGPEVFSALREIDPDVAVLSCPEPPRTTRCRSWPTPAPAASWPNPSTPGICPRPSQACWPDRVVS